MLVMLDGGSATLPSCANGGIGDRRQPRGREILTRVAMGGAGGFIRFLS